MSDYGNLFIIGVIYIKRSRLQYFMLKCLSKYLSKIVTDGAKGGPRPRAGVGCLGSRMYLVQPTCRTPSLRHQEHHGNIQTGRPSRASECKSLLGRTIMSCIIMIVDN